MEDPIGEYSTVSEVQSPTAPEFEVLPGDTSGTKLDILQARHTCERRSAIQ
jgi:hypothetical protein